MTEQLIGSAVMRTLSQKPLVMSHPGSSGLSDFYCNSSNATSHLVEAINRCGNIRITSNNLNLGATSNFSLSTSMLAYNPVLRLTITTNAQAQVYDGWGLDAIDQIEVSFPNSLASNMVVSGSALKEFLLYCQPDAEKRNNVIKMCGTLKNGAVGTTHHACIPLSGVLNRSLVDSSFPIDCSTLNGFLQINVTFTQGYIFTFDAVAGGNAPVVTLTACELIFSNSNILDAGFSIKNSLMMDPMSTYNIPSQWVAYTRRFVTLTLNAGAVSNFSDTSCPKGFLQAILFSVHPTAELAGAQNGTVQNFISPLDLTSLRLQYNGQDLFRADTAKEIDAYTRYKHSGDDLSYVYRFYVGRATNAIGLMQSRVYCIPLNYHSNSVRASHHLESLPSYDGASLDFSFTVSTGNRVYLPNATPLTDTDLNVANANVAQQCRVEIVWILSTIIEINSSSIDMQR